MRNTNCSDWISPSVDRLKCEEVSIQVRRLFLRAWKYRSPIFLTISFGCALLSLRHIVFPGGWGIGKDQKTVIKTEYRLSGDRSKEITVTNDSGKTFWDWLSLLGVPLSLFMLGVLFQYSQQQRANAIASEQQKRNENENKEDLLQLYFDRISDLLIAKNLIGIATHENKSLEQKELLEAASDVIRAITLSTLERFADDEERKTSIVKFLIETKTISLLGLILTRANFRGIDISGYSLSETQLDYADLKGARLINAFLHKTSIQRANLCGANLRDADFRDTDLTGTKLIKADLSNASLSNVNLSGADLSGAILNGTRIHGDSFLYKADLKGIMFDNDTIWPSAERLARAKNIPMALKQKFNIP